MLQLIIATKSDPQGKDDIMDMFNDIHIKENKTIVMISHDMDIVAKYAKRVVVLDKGKSNRV